METSWWIGTLNVVQHAIVGSLRAVVVKSAHVVCVATVSMLPMLPLVATAEAQSIDAARTAYIEGRFMEAAELAESLGTSEGFALASKSVTIQAYYISPDDEKDALFERALALAQEAIRSDPDDPEAHIQLSHVMGRHGQTIGVVESATKGYADRIRDTVENALRLSPEMPEAHLSMGMWHSEVVSSLGSFMADMMFGADEDDAIEFYKRALEGAPEERSCLWSTRSACWISMMTNTENRRAGCSNGRSIYRLGTPTTTLFTKRRSRL